MKGKHIRREGMDLVVVSDKVSAYQVAGDSVQKQYVDYIYSAPGVMWTVAPDEKSDSAMAGYTEFGSFVVMPIRL